MIISGSGTSSNETVLSSIFNEGEEVLLIRNGVFGERLLESIEKHNIPLVDCEFPWAEEPDLAKVEAVSYTHLDVYKRQGLHWEWRMPDSV